MVAESEEGSVEPYLPMLSSGEVHRKGVAAWGPVWKGQAELTGQIGQSWKDQGKPLHRVGHSKRCQIKSPRSQEMPEGSPAIKAELTLEGADVRDTVHIPLDFR